VYVAGRYRGSTPLQNLRLPPGTYEVRLVNQEQGLSRELTVRIRAGQPTKRVVNLRER
jgi:hypothetical protein